MSKVKNVHELSQLSKDRLEKILGNSNYAKLLWEFFHDAYEYDKPKKWWVDKWGWERTRGRE